MLPLQSPNAWPADVAATVSVKDGSLKERLGKGMGAWRRNRRRAAVWGSLALVCMAALSALLLLQGITRQIEDVTRSHAVLTAARELAHALSEVEANRNGFLLTGDQQFLSLFGEAVSRADLRAAELADLTADDPLRRLRVAEVTQAVAEGSQGLGGIDDEPDPRIMAERDETLARFIANEDAKNGTRNAEMERTRLGLFGALIAALAAAAVLASTLLWRTQRRRDVLETQIAERTKEIEMARAHAERERERVEALLQDTNHRVGNSLATVSSLLALQVMRSEQSEVREALEAARLRIHAIASAHRRLRLGDDLETASAQEFLGAVIEDIAETQADADLVTISSDIEPINVSSRDATTLGILVGELITNALKHAFPDGRSGTVDVRLFRNRDDVPVLIVRDNGVGLTQDQAATDGGLGSLIVRQLAGQFDGEPRYEGAATGGVEVTIALPGLARISPQSLEL